MFALRWVFLRRYMVSGFFTLAAKTMRLRQVFAG